MEDGRNVADIGFDYAELAVALALDAAAISVLAYGIYLRRHRRRDLVTAFAALNVGLFVVVQALSWVASTASLALGFGLFAALSLVRLRSEELNYREVAYFFSALALALVNGLALGRPLEAAVLSGVVLAVVWAVDRPRVELRPSRTSLVLDDVFAGEEALQAEVERRLGADVVSVTVNEIDYVRELTRIDVRYHPRRPAAAPAPLVPVAGGNGHAEVIGLGR
jgi:hypothetical protein